jgi:hypothetical protein
MDENGRVRLDEPAAIPVDLHEVSLAGAAMPGAITEVSATAVGIF